MIFDPIAALSRHQRASLAKYAEQLRTVNRRFNLVAPSTLREMERVHLQHSLALSQRGFPSGVTVVDWGAGGGLPTVPLAIAFPETRFIAVDAVGKKTQAVRLFARRLGLDNLRVWNGRAEAYDGPAPHYAVSRATAPLADLWAWTERVRQPFDPARLGTEDDPPMWAPGLLTLKGGDLAEELAALPDGTTVERHDLAGWMGDAFATKELLHVRPAE